MKISQALWTFILSGLLLLSCSSNKNEQLIKSGIEEAVFGTMPDGREIKSYTLKNANGLEMKAITYGGIITSLKIPDKKGAFEDIVLGYDNLQSYLDNNPYFGAIIGRYGNRIGHGTFLLDGETYVLAKNNGKNHLHGGVKGFDKVVWDVEEISKEDGLGLIFSYRSIDIEEGYPGNLDATVSYFLNNDNELSFQYSARTDIKTVVNLTQHSYFNLSAMREDILGHILEINASGFLPVDNSLIPTGEIKSVEGTPFDFRMAKAIGMDIESQNEQIQFGKGYDHNWVLDQGDSPMNYAASLYDAKSGRFMEIYTEEPGLQFYSGNFLDGSIKGKNGIVYQLHSGLCLETQHYPDSPNKEGFPTVLLIPGEEYNTKTIYKFSVK